MIILRTKESGEATRRNIPEDLIPHYQRFENLKSRIFFHNDSSVFTIAKEVRKERYKP